MENVFPANFQVFSSRNFFESSLQITFSKRYLGGRIPTPASPSPPNIVLHCEQSTLFCFFLLSFEFFFFLQLPNTLVYFSLHSTAVVAFTIFLRTFSSSVSLPLEKGADVAGRRCISREGGFASPKSDSVVR